MRWLRGDGVVPLAVEFVQGDVDCGHLCFGDFDACRVAVGIDLASYLQAGVGGGGGSGGGGGLLGGLLGGLGGLL